MPAPSDTAADRAAEDIALSSHDILNLLFDEAAGLVKLARRMIDSMARNGGVLSPWRGRPMMTSVDSESPTRETNTR
jgi:hypothetical protein